MTTESSIKYVLNFDEPSDAVLEWAEKNIREDPDLKCQILSDFRDLIYSRGECNPNRTDDAYLLRFLRARHFYPEKAHQLLVNYYRFKENNPEYHKNITIDVLEKAGKMQLIDIPTQKDQNGRRMVIFKLGRWNPSEMTIDEIFSILGLIQEIALLEQDVQILGGVCIVDLSNLSLQQTWYMSPTLAQKIIEFLVTANPLRIHSFHIVNQSWIFDVAYNLFKPLLNETMRERLFFHGSDRESLHKHIEPKYLPESFGGYDTDGNYFDWVNSFKADERVIKEMGLLGYPVEKLKNLPDF